MLYVGMYVCSNTYISTGKLNICIQMAYYSKALPPCPWIVQIIPLPLLICNLRL